MRCSRFLPLTNRGVSRVTGDSAATTTPAPQAAEPLVVDLRDPRLAGVLAWLIPGAGHLYQGRYGKGILFMVCILGIYFFGMYLGQGRVVYASLRAEDRRLPYLCQIGVGLPALPALIQSMRMHGNPPKPPLWGGWMAPPRLVGQPIPRDPWAAEHGAITQGPNVPYVINRYDELSAWQERLHGYFELGTVYTMIAGLLNVLAIYDAASGPLLIASDEEDDESDQPKKS